MNSCFLVGEIGINHNGNLNFAKKLINELKLQDLMLLNFKKRYKRCLLSGLSK